MTRGTRAARGFTLAELMIVMAIVGTLAVLAIPGFQTLIQNNRRAVTVNELIATFMNARGEAAKRGQTVTVCATTSASPSTCSGGTAWSYGWMAFVDTNANGVFDAGETLLRQYVNDYAGSVTITAVPVAGTNPANGTIMLQPFNQAGTQATVKVYDKRCKPTDVTQERSANIATTGRASVSPLDSSGTPLDVTGAALTCP